MIRDRLPILQTDPQLTKQPSPHEPTQLPQHRSVSRWRLFHPRRHGPAESMTCALAAASR
jgi:hypothetical protein